MTYKKIDLSKVQWKEPLTPFDFSGSNSNGETVSMNQQYFIKNGEPWFPVMGEFHFSRYPEDQWEEELLKIKSGGVGIVATYVFWIHHEEEKEIFDWSGQRNLGKFVRLCKRHGLMMWLRVGPWAHGECRNGGFPDWIEKGGFETRCDSEPYLTYVERFFREIYHQVEGMMYKDGGPIVGIQLENEYGHCGGYRGEKGIQHIRTLKQLCQQIGFITPFYTTTAWGGGVVVDGETIPVFGGYVEAPWDQHIHEQSASREYLFERPGIETNIGADLQTEVSKESEFQFSLNQYPYVTAELGGGVQVTQHRRPYIAGSEIEACVLTKLASGISLVGYYMYHGGTNPKGKLSTLQESKATGMYNDLPERSYDFQAPLREYGQMNDSYRKLRRLHRFLQDFGKELAVTQTYLPEELPKDPEDMETLRYSVRYGKLGGFLFLNNFQRRREMTDKKDVNITIQTEKEDIQFPSFDLYNGDYWIFPFQLALGQVFLRYSTAQLLCRLSGKLEDTYVFFGDKDQGIEVCLEGSNIQHIETVEAEVERIDSNVKIKVPMPNKKVHIQLTMEDGSHIQLLVLNREEAEQASKVVEEGSEYLIITTSDLYQSEDGIHLCSRKSEGELFVYPISEKLFNRNSKYLISREPIGDFGFYGIDYLSDCNEKEELPINIAPQLKETKAGGIVTEFDLPKGIIWNINKCFLKVGFVGDQAGLWINGEKEADWFYLGDTWEIELKRFVKKEETVHFRLEVDPLYQKDFVYLDRPPIFENGVCCRLDTLVIEQEYRILLEGSEL